MKIIKPSAPTLILLDRRIMQQQCQQWQGHFGMGFVSGGGNAATTWNPLDKATTVVLSAGNLSASIVGAADNDIVGVRSTTSKTALKLYFEQLITSVDSGGEFTIGLTSGSLSLTGPGRPGNASGNGAGYYGGTGTIRSNGVNRGTAAALTAGDRIGMAIDCGTQTFAFSKNGSWQLGADPSAGTGMITYGAVSPIFATAFYAKFGTGSPSVTANFGASAFTYTPPTGYVAWG